MSPRFVYFRMRARRPSHLPEIISSFMAFAFIRQTSMLMHITGYGTYTWARNYDEWQNSKAAHVAGHGGH